MITKEQLIAKYPRIFSPDFYFEHESGWNGLVDGLCRELTEWAARNDVEVSCSQCKEKFGTLRFYYDLSNPVSDDAWLEAGSIVDKYEQLSSQTCEVTGEPGGLCLYGSLLKTLCTKKATELEFKVVLSRLDRFLPPKI